MDNPERFTITEAVVSNGQMFVAVRRSTLAEGCDEWIVAPGGGRFSTRVSGFNAALDRAEQVALGLEVARASRELAEVVEDRLAELLSRKEPVADG